MYLKEENRKAVTDFLNSPLWSDIKRCLLDRRPAMPGTKEAVHTQAAQGFLRAGFEGALIELEKLPFDLPVQPRDPFDRPALEPAD